MKYSLCFMCLSIFSSLVFSQVIRNANFEESCLESSTGICDWDLSWGAIESIQKENQGLLLTGNGGVIFLEQSILLQSQEDPEIFTLRTRIKTEGLEGKGAGLNVAAYDKEGNLLTNKDLGGYGGFNRVKGDTDWDTYQVRIICPAKTHKINIGIIIYGKGKAYYDDVEVLFRHEIKHG